MDPVDIAIINQNLPVLIRDMDTMPLIDHLMSFHILLDEHQNKIIVSNISKMKTSAIQIE
jgi:hypothetical protein